MVDGSWLMVDGSWLMVDDGPGRGDPIPVGATLECGGSTPL